MFKLSLKLFESNEYILLIAIDTTRTAELQNVRTLIHCQSECSAACDSVDSYLEIDNK